MKILVVGAGLTGCSIARILKDRKHNVLIIEKQSQIGGLCITKISPNGLKYEPFGARIFHTKNPNIVQFIVKFDDFNDYVHRKGMIINGKLFPMPLSKESIKKFKEKDQILQEINNRPSTIDETNFETACISIFGETLYSYFIQNYTLKMWGIQPRSLTAEWVSKRLELREMGDNIFFRGQWQGVPKHGYSFLLKSMINDIPIELNTSTFNPDDYDIVVLSAPIDKIMKFKFGKLPYRSIKFSYKENELWEKNDYGTINLPQHPSYLRKCNFKVIHKQTSPNNYIQYQRSIEADDNNISMYPINTEENNQLFDKYLMELCKRKNICPIGRLGLYKYLDMDKAVELAFAMLSSIENYLNRTPQERYDEIKAIVKDF